MSFAFPKKKLPSTIGLRIAAGYSLLVLPSFLALMIFSHMFMASLLERHDQERVVLELQSLEASYLEGGREAVAREVLANDRFRRNNPFFTRISGPDQASAEVFLPQYWRGFDLDLPGVAIGGAEPGWRRLPARQGKHALEILGAALPGGGLLEVGISSEERETTLRRLRETFLLVSLPLVVLVLAGGGLLAHRSLLPVRQLVRTLIMINAGRRDARAPRTGRGDELDELGRLFNAMFERIDALVHGMKNALDSVAHDLRTPMTRFHNRAEAALRQAESPEDCREALQTCVEEAANILRLLNTLMDLSEAETGTLHLHLREVDLSGLAASVAEMYRFVAEERGIALEAAIPDGVRATLDPERISQALANLLDNAVKYTPAGGRVELRLETAPGEILVQVADNGGGIDPDDQERIWDRLYRGRRDSTKGLGIGLSLVRAVVLAHGGTARSRNLDPGGALFEISLPADGMSAPRRNLSEM